MTNYVYKFIYVIFNFLFVSSADYRVEVMMMTNKVEETTPNTIPKSKKAIVAKLQEDKTSTMTTNIMLTNKTYVLSSNFTSNTSYIIHVIARTSVGYGARHDPVKFTTSVDFQGKYILTILLDFYLYLIIGKYIHTGHCRDL